MPYRGGFPPDAYDGHDTLNRLSIALLYENVEIANLNQKLWAAMGCFPSPLGLRKICHKKQIDLFDCVPFQEID